MKMADSLDLVISSVLSIRLDPDGNFVEALGRQHTPEEAAKVINAHIGDWSGQLKKSV